MPKAQSVFQSSSAKLLMLALLSSSLRKAATVKDRARWSTERQILKKSQKRHFYASRNLKDSVYAFGDNSLSQCGVLEEANTSVPRKVQELQQNLDVVAIVAGWKGTMLLTGSFLLFDGQLLYIALNRSNAFYYS
jgi:alpha-tubulin suppressor-like RCC1 family protein